MTNVSSKVAKMGLTGRQQKWFASVREGLERDTGKSLDDWVKIARKCPQTTPRGRVKWLKDKHGLGVNRAATILDAAFGELSWDQPEKRLDGLWKDPAHRAIYDRIEAAARTLEGTTVGPRKTVSTFSRKVQYAAAKPFKGAVRLALCLAPAASRRLEPVGKSEGFNERLTSAVTLVKSADVDARIKKLLKSAWERA
jgi:hypothetical protein